MSDPVTNMQREDVLSSIRRLVSSDADAHPGDAAALSSGKLVLTPAQRVVQDDAAQGAHRKSDLSKPMLLTQPVPESVNPNGHGATALSSDGAEDASGGSVLDKALLGMVESELTEAMVARGRGKTAAQDAVPVEKASKDQTAPTRKPSDVDAGAELEWRSRRPKRARSSAMTLEQKIAELESLISGGSDTRPPESDAVSEQPEEVAGDEDETYIVDELIWKDYTARPKAVEAERGDPEDDDAHEDADLTQASSGETQDVPSSLVYRHTVPQKRSDRLSSDKESATAPDLDDRNAATIDEDMLRDLVADIVRQELQGALGERITRNVRKLVRREIQHALMAQKFD